MKFLPTCPHCPSGGPPIGVEIRGVYDGTAYFECANCGDHWHAWPEGHRIRAEVEHYWSEIDGRSGRDTPPEA